MRGMIIGFSVPAIAALANLACADGDAPSPAQFCRLPLGLYGRRRLPSARAK